MKNIQIKDTEKNSGYYELTICENRVETTVGFFTLDYSMNPIEISYFEIGNDFRGSGLGKSALEEIIKFVQFMGFTSIRLLVSVENEKAQHIYRKAGFNFLADYMSEWCYKMEKLL
jgi:ribosomal protein S18 acetylase RimI-like enzyme